MNWKTIQEFPNYEVSDTGLVRNIETKKILKNSYDRYGYAQVKMYPDNITKRIHRFVATEFIANEKNLSFVNHIDGCKSNNNINNLEWVSASENTIHAYKNNLHSNNKKVKNKQTGKIYEMASEAARELGLQPRAVSNAANPNHTRKTAGGYEWQYIGGA
jgi:hypothetical protein